VGLAGCSSPAADNGGSGGNPQGSASTEKVTVGVIPIVDVAPIYLGKQKGFFSSRGIDLNLVAAQGGAAVIPGVVSDQFQFGFSNVTSLMIAASKNLPLKITNAGRLVHRQGRRRLRRGRRHRRQSDQDGEGLAGKSVAVNTLKNIGDVTVRASVRKAGGDPSKVKFTELAFPDMPAALAGKKVDAAWVVEPFLSAIKAQGGRSWPGTSSTPRPTCRSPPTSPPPS
jgi:NitT/TauT family transport system substrate-binding protein